MINIEKVFREKEIVGSFLLLDIKSPDIYAVHLKLQIHLICNHLKSFAKETTFHYIALSHHGK